jgi:hypothetical protein
MRETVRRTGSSCLNLCSNAALARRPMKPSDAPGSAVALLMVAETVDATAVSGRMFHASRLTMRNDALRDAQRATGPLIARQRNSVRPNQKE